jgi:AraC-like DNA-binding protein
MTALSHRPRDAARLCTRLAPAVRLIESRLAERLSIPDVALEISSYHFVRLFNQTAGLTPHQNVVSRRLERARHSGHVSRPSRERRKAKRAAKKSAATAANS